MVFIVAVRRMAICDVCIVALGEHSCVIVAIFGSATGMVRRRCFRSKGGRVDGKIIVAVGCKVRDDCINILVVVKSMFDFWCAWVLVTIVTESNGVVRRGLIVFNWNDFLFR